MEEKRVVGVFDEEIDVVLEAMKISPHFCFVHVPRLSEPRRITIGRLDFSGPGTARPRLPAYSIR